ncbi:DUF2550 domain-containing protein [Phaeacidiphilus oryzae]|jgi:hypothetical protein|uniref:DUF2550 domain-containing protein n=1 Tax=Phaeacidiphilus oryzae TaxID=348818 RepID=UPI0005619622|nr:DUF2550 domain-containing protein [Phaeacidiphilus oryzae]
MVLALVVAAVVVVVALAGLSAFAVRRRLIQRVGGTFDCSLRLRMPEAAEIAAVTAAEAAAQEAPSDVPESGAEQAAASAGDGKGWVFGVARYNGDDLEWFRVFSYSPRPRRVLRRPLIEVVSRRTPEGQEELALLSGAVVLSARVDGEPIELAMSEDALTGFLAWLEAAPPGQRVNVA